MSSESQTSSTPWWGILTVTDVSVPQKRPRSTYERRLAVKRLASHTGAWIVVVDVGLLLIFGFLSPGASYLGTRSLQNIAFDAAQIVLLAGAAAFELAAAQIDISLGAIVVLSSVVGGKVIQGVGGTASQVQAGVYPHLSLALVLGVLAACLTGAAFGFVNGLIVARLRVTSFIATLATTGIGTGIALIITNGTDLAFQPVWLQAHFGTALAAGIPIPALVVGVIMVILWAIMRFSRFGLRTLAVGSSETSAERAGISAGRQVVAVLTLAGLLAGAASILDLARFLTTNVAGHTLDALSAVAGAVIGGCSLFGGRASVGGAVAGALLAIILETGLVAVGLSPFYQQIAVGVVLIAAVYVDGRRRRAPRPADQAGGSRRLRLLRRR
jgi:ribose transport system permease protein